jgi:ParB/RepB/Spo0J family partition protein
VPRSVLKSTRAIPERPTETEHKAAVRAESRRKLQPSALVSIPMSEIAETPENLNSRITYDEDSLQELAESIREHGILQPLVVRPLQPHEMADHQIRINGQVYHAQYVLIAGNRRYRAGRMAGLREFPCVLRVTTADRAFILDIVENCQRRDLTGRERARAISMLASLRGENEAAGGSVRVVATWKGNEAYERASRTLTAANPRSFVAYPTRDRRTCDRTSPGANIRAVRTATLNEGRAMDALRILSRIDAVEDAGPVRDLLVLIHQRVNELLAFSESAEHLPKANTARWPPA